MKSLIIADDLTGANVSNSLLAKNGLKVGTIDSLDGVGNFDKYDVLGFHTDSRGDEPKEAYDKVYELTNKLKDKKVNFFNKRIDSTLRGNIGAEIDGMMDALGPNVTAMLVPGFPSADKIVIGNYMVIDGVMLQDTDVKNDPTSPVHDSRVVDILRKQTNKSVGVISMESILEGETAIVATIRALIDNGARIIMFDSCTDADIDLIAKSVIKANMPFISVDPGPFTNSLLKVLAPKQDYKEKQKSLFVIGSVSSIVQEQISQFRAKFNPAIFKVNARDLLYPDKRTKEIQRVTAEVIASLDSNSMFLIATMIERQDKLNLAEEAKKAGLSISDASKTICSAMAQIGFSIVNQSNGQIGGVYTSGGDITKAFLQENEAKGIEIKDEIVPLAVYGRIIGGKLDDMPIVTKGGLIGDKTTLAQCADYLTTKISDAFYKEG